MQSTQAGCTGTTKSTPNMGGPMKDQWEQLAPKYDA